MNNKAFRAILGLSLLLAPTVTWAQEGAAYRPPAPRIVCSVASSGLDQAGRAVESSVRKRCDALWTRSVRRGGGWRYEDFMRQCAQSCPAQTAANPPADVPQLNTLGAQAAQSATGGVGTGGGFTTALLVGGGVAAAAGVGLAASHHSPGPADQPASP